MSPSINSSRLRRLLGDATGLGAEVPSPDLASGLGAWLGAYDAMTLHGALQAVHAMADAPATRAAATPPDAASLHALDVAFSRLRDGLVKAITVGDAPVAAGGWRGGAPRGAAATPAVAPQVVEVATDYGAFHKRYLDLQRQMELRIGPFRAQVREGLGRASVPLKQLAALDAVLEQTLGPREQRLMGTVPVFLERRYEQLRQAQPAEAGVVPRWLATFENDFQQVLLAELNSRLQPVVGMMEAFSRALGPTVKTTQQTTQKKTQ